MNIWACIIIVIVCLPLSLLCIYRFKSLFNYGSIFCLLWMLIGVLANSGILSYYLPSFIVNCCIVVGCAFVGIIYLLGGTVLFDRKNYILSTCTKVNYKLILVSNILVLTYLIPFFLRAVKIIISKGFIYLRMVAGTNSTELGTTDLHANILQSICYPIIISSVLIGIVLFFLRDKVAIRLLVVPFTNLVLYSLINAARNGFVIVFIFCFFSYFIFLFPVRQKKERKNKKSKFFVIVALVLFTLILYILTKERSSKNHSFFESIYVYFVGGPVYLTQLIKHMSEYTINKDLFFGSVTFGFIYNILAIVGKFIGVEIPITDYVVNSKMLTEVYAISPNMAANAMSTVFFSFLLDWGYFGIVMGPLLVAIVTVIVDKKSKSKGNIRWHAIGIYWYYFIYRTIFKYDGISITFFFTFFFVFLFTSNSKKIRYKIKLRSN